MVFLPTTTLTYFPFLLFVSYCTLTPLYRLPHFFSLFLLNGSCPSITFSDHINLFFSFLLLIAVCFIHRVGTIWSLL